MDPRTATIVSRYADLLDRAKHGTKRPLIEAACQELGVAAPTFYRLLDEVRVSNRKKRADAGNVGLTLQEATAISSYLMEGFRQNGKRRAISLETAVDVLRANDKIVAARVDEATGEILPLSLSAISRALQGYNLHPEQLRNPEPHIKLRTRHPNEMWQVDGSVCVLYYLEDGAAYIEELDEGKHYKNKPHNLKAIEQHRVIRYVLTDHTTNVTRWRYYPHAESAEHSVRFLCWAMAPKPDASQDPFHGRPKILYVDPGATAGGLVKRLCVRLGIEMRAHKPRNSKATGSVENGQWRVESKFEQGLRFQKHRVRNFDDLNRLAHDYQLYYNATKLVGRHKMTRFEAWLHIREHELITTQPEATLLDLATREPEKRQVSSNLTVQFQGRTWGVKGVPGVMVKGSVYVHRHPFRDCAMAVVEDADGRETHIELPDLTGTVDPTQQLWGFQTDAATPDEYKARPDTAGDTNRKRVALVASGEETQEADQKARRKKDFTPYGGEINPFKEAEEAELPTYLKKRGTALNAAPPTVELIPLTHIQAAKLLKGKLGDTWTADHFGLIQKRYPGGVPEADIELLLEEFQGKSPAHKPVLTVVK